jgi:DNA/RNA endonuclease YhcR with UshA esterase domain
MKVLLAMTVALPTSAAFIGGTVAHAEGPSDPAPFINAKVVNQNAGKKVLFDNTHGQTAGAADWVIDGGFSDFGNALANDGFYVKELRKSTTITYDDLKDYDVFIIGEANNPYKPSEQAAMLQYVQNGGSIFFIADHYNADRNKNRWDASEVFNGYRRGAWSNPAKGMSAEEAASAPMQGVVSSDWLGQNFGLRFRYNALSDITADNVVAPDQAFGITQGVSTVAMHAGATLAILDPKKAKGIVYLPQTNEPWASAVDQGVYNGGGVAEGPMVAVSKLGGGKAGFIGDSSPVEDATPKYLKEENGQPKTTYDGFKEQNDGTLLVNMVEWLSKKESYTTFDQVSGEQLDQTTQLLPTEDPASSTEPQAEPWSAPAAGYKWWDPSTFKPGSYGSTAVVNNPTYSMVHQAQLPSAQDFQVRVVADNLVPGSTLNGSSIGIYLNGGTQVGLVQNADGSWPTTPGYSQQFSMTADQLGHAYKELNVRIKAGTTLGAANLRLKNGSNNVKTEAVTIANVPAEPLPTDKPPVPAAISIKDARATNNTLVTVTGVVTSKPGIFGGTGFYLQDATGGLYIYPSSANFSVGDVVSVSGKLSPYNTEQEMGTVLAMTKTGTASVPAPQVATSVNDANQGQLVTLQNVKIANLVSAAPSGSFEFDALAADGTTAAHVRVDTRIGLNQSQFAYKEGQIVDISGVAAIFKGVYQLKPLAATDIVGDTVAPTTQASVSGTPNDNGWYNQDVMVTLTATDDKSGVATTEYSVTDGTWQPYNGPITISGESTTALKFHSIDKSGNVEAAQTLTINLDKTAPITTASPAAQPNANGWYNQDVTIALNGVDSNSGVASTEYKLNNGDWTAYTGTVTVSAEGSSDVQYRSTDKAGNVETAGSLSVLLDKTAPTATLTQSGTSVHNVNIDGTVSFNVAATDNGSGVASQELLLDGKVIENGASISALSLGLGAHTIDLKVTDKAGNVTTQSFTFLIDTSFASIHNLLDQFGKSGDLKNGGIQTSLNAKLDNAEKQFTKGHQDQAVNSLQDLQKNINTFVANGNISATAGDVLNKNIDYLLTTGLK